MKKTLSKAEKEQLKADCETFRFWKGHKSNEAKEDGFQKRVAEYLDRLGYVWAHIPNEAKRSYALAKHLEKQGMKSGMPDVLIFDRLIAIELKAGKNTPSQNQIEWMKRLSSCGWKVAWVNSFDEFLSFLNECYES